MLVGRASKRSHEGHPSSSPATAPLGLTLDIVPSHQTESSKAGCGALAVGTVATPESAAEAA